MRRGEDEREGEVLQDGVADAREGRVENKKNQEGGGKKRRRANGKLSPLR